ncbi:MAG TPA: iron transporter [Rhizomicrobium sp.]|nr:iron transporter [Rhizomicrobium sp.]
MTCRLASPPAWAAAIGGPMLRDGIEIVPAILSGVEVDRLTVRGADSIWLAADVQAAKDGRYGFTGFIPYLSISFVLTKDDVPTFKRAGLLFPLAAKDGPHYAAAADMAGPGVYRLTYIVSPPSAHGMLRRTDKTDGVPEWFKPITASWDFKYPMSAK